MRDIAVSASRNALEQRTKSSLGKSVADRARAEAIKQRKRAEVSALNSAAKAETVRDWPTYFRRRTEEVYYPVIATPRERESLINWRR